MSLGGVLGGVFAALLSPLLFVDVLEFPVLLGLGLLLREEFWPAGWRTDARRVLLWSSAAMLVAAGLFFALRGLGKWPPGGPRLWIVAALALATLLLIGPRARAGLAAALAVIIAAAVLPPEHAPMHTTRSFFGTHRVIESPNGRFHTLLHGTTLHGAEMRRDGDGKLVERPQPLTYYHPNGPLASGLALVRTTVRPGSPGQRFGIVGLGAGAMACYAREGERWRFFEIDPEVVRIARDQRYFRYLPVCQPQADIVLGDARLTLAREADAAFDYLLIDAFSSDAIPVHMLTREALALFLAKLAPRGVLVLHVSNQNLDLVPTVEATLATLPDISAVYAQGLGGGGALPSQAVVISRDASLIEPALGWHAARKLGASTARPWTDDHSDILAPIWGKWRGK